ncbi:MAG: UvrB/UvrC motif-containing protein [bacterium]
MFAEESPDWNIDLDGSVTCELCGEEPATLHLLRVVDGAVSHTHLCPGCAEGVAEQTSGLALVLAVPSVLRHLGKKAAEDEKAAPLPSVGDERFCSVCGTTLFDLKESGLVGCSKCYQVFAEHLQAALEGHAEPMEHLGKMPHRGPESDVLRHEVMRLQRMLRELVECERFEEAAGVRDRLTELGERLEGEPS